VVVVDGYIVKINGTFRHHSCLRVSISNKPWASLTYTMCTTICYLTNFKLRVIRKDKSIEKQGTRTTKGGRQIGVQIGYLSLLKLTTCSQLVSKQLKIGSSFHWTTKLRIVPLTVKLPFLKELVCFASNEHNVYKFCIDISQGVHSIVKLDTTCEKKIYFF